MYLDLVTLKTCPQFFSAPSPQHVLKKKKKSDEFTLVRSFLVLPLTFQNVFADFVTSILSDCKPAC